MDRVNKNLRDLVNRYNGNMDDIINEVERYKIDSVESLKNSYNIITYDFYKLPLNQYKYEELYKCILILSNRIENCDYVSLKSILDYIYTNCNNETQNKVLNEIYQSKFGGIKWKKKK